MGYGSFMKITNNSANPITTFITSAYCMYDQGQDGSNLSLFNNATIPSGQSLPSSGNGQYIEVQNSGTCWFNAATFNLKVAAADGSLISNVTFTDSTANWYYSNSNPDAVNVYVNNTGDQGVIDVTIAPLAGASQ